MTTLTQQTLSDAQSAQFEQERFRCAFICHYIPLGSLEASRGYRPFYNFDGEVVEVSEATGDGPCGVSQADTGPH